MRTEPVARVGSTGAAASAPGLVRGALFLGGSVLLHGVAALLFLGEPMVHPAVAPPPAIEVEVGWSSGRVLPPTALAGVKRPAPRRAREPVAPPSVAERVAPALGAREGQGAPAATEAPSAPEAAAESGPETQPVGPLAALSEAGGGAEGLGSAGKPSAPPGGGLGAGGGVGPGGSGDLSAYGERLSSLVTRQRRYPASAVRLRMEGTPVVHVRVHRDGSLAAAPRLVTSSRYGVLDAEALRMVEAAAPFAPLPEGHPHPFAEFVVPVRFSLRSSE